MQKGTDFVGVSATCICHDGNGRIVMAKRNANCRDEHGKWEFGGGGVEFGEKIEDTIHREVKEEYCTDVLKFEFLGYRDLHRIHQGKKTHWVCLDFKCLVDASKVSNGEPHKFDDVAWFTLDNLPEQLHSEIPRCMKLYSDKLK